MNPTYSWDEAMGCPMAACSECGALVADQLRHTNWHEQMGTT